MSTIKTGDALYRLYRKRSLELNQQSVPEWQELPEKERHVWDQMVWDLPDERAPDRSLLNQIRDVCSANTTARECMWAVSRISRLLYDHMPKNSAPIPSAEPTIQERAAHWLIEQEDDGFTPEQRAQFEAWLAESPSHRATYEALEHAWEETLVLRNQRTARG